MFWKTLVLALFVVGVFGEYQLDDEKKEKLKELLKKQCDTAGAPESASSDLATSVQGFISCISQLIDMKTVKDEIEAAKPNGALDEVFKKYCAKSPQFKSCIHSMVDSLAPCLDDTSKAQLGSAKNGSDQLIDFVCYKDGDRIALFIAENGPQCFQDKNNEIRACATEAQKGQSLDTAKDMPLADKCRKYDDLSKCIVEALEQCENPTPGNMAEALFKYVRKSSPCNSALPKE